MRTLLLLAVICFASMSHRVLAQCASAVPLGSAFNMFTQINNNTNPVAVNKDLNTVLFLHRHNSNTFGGNSGNLRYDWSTSAGSTWTTNLGVLNPVSQSFARYPNAAIHNPISNTNPANAYVSYLASTTSNGFWDGVVTGVRQLNATGNTESYNQPGASGYLVASSLVKGAPGVFWAVDRVSNGTTFSGGINVYQGIFNTGINDVVWSTNTVLYPSYNTGLNGWPAMDATKIAFDPSGTNGWICLMTHINSNPSTYAYYPVFYYTTNGGLSWSGPVVVSLNQLPCISTNMGSATAASDGEAALLVDAQGNPHLLTIIGQSMNNYSLNNSGWRQFFDITLINNQWTAHHVSTVKGIAATLSGPNNSVIQSLTPQAARTADGSKMFFGWTDNSTYNIGAANYSPNFFARGFDTQQNLWTPVKDFTSCNFNTSGLIFFPHLAEQVMEPSAGQYKLAPVYGQFTSGTDPDQAANFSFLNNVTFAASEFSITSGVTSVSILQGSTALMCPGTPITLQLTGNYTQISWSGGGTGYSKVITAPGVYSVTASTGCATGSASINVTALTMSVAGVSTLCVGNSATLTVNGNAPSYTWMPGGATGTTYTVAPLSTTVYYVIATGSESCTAIVNHTITTSPPANVVILSNLQSICAGESVTLQATGAAAYVWNTTATATMIVVSPTNTTIYSVTGVNSQGCQGSKSYTQTVNPCIGLREAAEAAQDFNAYPNPVSRSLQIYSRDGGEIRLINGLGQEVRRFEVNPGIESSYDIEDLDRGLYFLARPGYVQTVRIIVE
jgi:hypothetical protein